MAASKNDARRVGAVSNAVRLLQHRVASGNYDVQDGEEEKPVDKDLLPVYPSIPSILMDDEAVERTEFSYSDRAPEDWVISGPLGDSGKGKGRPFDTWADAEAWAREFYGYRFKGRKPDEPGSLGRWAFVIRGPRGTTN